MKKLIVHPSETEAAGTTIASLLARVRAGTEILIENEDQPVVVIRAVEPVRRSISDCIALLPEDSTGTIDPAFSHDVAAAVESQSDPLNPPAWE
jgi:antitoxin (DNA-binding transcriptional repressor) of toxin-antitoxin stability system